MLGFFQNIGMPETILIAIVSILLFGKRLPEVAARAAVQVQRARRALSDLRRETGIDSELREARRAIDEAARMATPRTFEFSRPEDLPPAPPRVVERSGPAAPVQERDEARPPRAWDRAEPPTGAEDAGDEPTGAPELEPPAPAERRPDEEPPRA